MGKLIIPDYIGLRLVAEKFNIKEFEEAISLAKFPLNDQIISMLSLLVIDKGYYLSDIKHLISEMNSYYAREGESVE